MKTVSAKARFSARAKEVIRRAGGRKIMRAIRAFRDNADPNDAHDALFDVIDRTEFKLVDGDGTVVLRLGAGFSDPDKLVFIFERQED